MNLYFSSKGELIIHGFVRIPSHNFPSSFENREGHLHWQYCKGTSVDLRSDAVLPVVTCMTHLSVCNPLYRCSKHQLRSPFEACAKLKHKHPESSTAGTRDLKHPD